MPFLPRFLLGLVALAASASAFAQSTDRSDADRRAKNVDEALVKYRAHHDRSTQAVNVSASSRESVGERTHDAAQSVRNFTHRQADSVRHFNDRRNKRSHLHTAPSANPGE